MTADEQGFVTGTGPESQDFVAITDKMARGILGAPEVINATKPPILSVMPVVNNTRFAFNQDMLIRQIENQLISKSQEKVRFVAYDRMAELEQDRNEKIAGNVVSNYDPNIVEYKGADYYLTGVFDGHSTRTSEGTSDFIVYSFRLINARDRVVIWGDSAEIKKQGLEDAIYR